VPTEGSLLERYRTLWHAMATGEITPDQAVAAGRLLGLERQAAESTFDLAALRAELEATIRAEVEAALRAELTDKIRAEVIAEIRAELVKELRGEGATVPPAAAPAADRQVDLKNTCISRSAPIAAALTLPARGARRAPPSPAGAGEGQEEGPRFTFPSPASAGEGGAQRAALGG
jgi:hypothetical protein